LRLDIVIPAHNEEHRIDRTLHAYRTGCPRPDVRFLVAADACTDRTTDIVRAHGERDRRVQLFEYPKLGKGGVIAATFRRSDADLVGFVDADCATPPAELLRIARVAAAERADGAIASRNHPASVLPRRRTPVRRLTSAGFAFGVRRLLGLPYSDTQCGAKVLRRHAVERIVPRIGATDLLFDVDLLLAARETGQRIVEVPTVWIDQDGSRVDPVADTRKMGVSLLRMWAQTRRRGGEDAAGVDVHEVAREAEAEREVVHA
jgi:glycosyltransferase involved in cell wall biosynthesis